MEKGLDGQSVDIRTTAGSHCWFIQGFMDKAPVNLLVDTGAAPNVLNWEVYQRLSSSVGNMSLYECTDKLHSAGGDLLNVHGSTEITLKIGDKDFTIPYVVVDLGEIDGILDMSFFKQERCIIDAFRGCMAINGCDIMMHHFDSLPHSCHIELNDDVIGQPDIGSHDMADFHEVSEIETMDYSRFETELLGDNTQVNISYK